MYLVWSHVISTHSNYSCCIFTSFAWVECGTIDAEFMGGCSAVWNIGRSASVWQWGAVCLWPALVSALQILSCTLCLLLQDNTTHDPGPELHCSQDTGHQSRTEDPEGDGFLCPHETPSQGW